MTSAYLTNWLYVAAFVAVRRGAGRADPALLGQARQSEPPSAEKYSTYECGIEPVGDSWQPFAVRYYIFALLFLVFDVEAVFLFPWSIVFRTLGTAGFVEMVIFVPCSSSAWSTPGARGSSSGSDRARRRPSLPQARASSSSSPNVITTTADLVFNWARSHSVFPFTYGLACCAIEMLSSGFARFDIARYGMEVFRPTPRQCDLMIVAGTVNEKMAPVLKRLYDQMAEPKWVISMGACATSGGPFYDGYNVVNGVDKIVPVDVYIPGCPPRPEALFQGMLELQKKIEKMSFVPAAGRVGRATERGPSVPGRRDRIGEPDHGRRRPGDWRPSSSTI